MIRHHIDCVSFWTISFHFLLSMQYVALVSRIISLLLLPYHIWCFFLPHIPLATAMLQPSQFLQLWIALVSVSVLTWAAPTETSEEGTLPVVNPPSAEDLEPRSPTENPAARPWSGLSGWASFVGGFPRRRSPPGEIPPGSSGRSGRRQNQPGGGGGRGRRGGKIILVPDDLPNIPEGAAILNAIEKSRRRGSESRGSKESEETVVDTFDATQGEQDTESPSGAPQESSGGRLGRGSGGRRGGRRKEDTEPQEEKPDVRRFGSRGDKKKARPDEPAKSETQEDPATSNPDDLGTDEVPSFGAPPGFGQSPPGFGQPPPGFGAPPPSFAAPGSFDSSCGDVLETRAGNAKETVEALLKNIDNPDELRPIIADIDINVNGPEGV